MSHIAQLFKAARMEVELTRKDLAVAAGYRSLNKGLRRLAMVEDGQNMLPDSRIVGRFAAVLGIDDADITNASALDLQELHQPIRPYLVERLMAAVYRRHQLPGDCTESGARSLAAKLSAETGRSFCLVLSKVRAVYFYPSGQYRESHCGLCMSIGRYNARTCRTV